jgi:hypothetical protein
MQSRPYRHMRFPCLFPGYGWREGDPADFDVDHDWKPLPVTLQGWRTIVFPDVSLVT